MEKLNKLNKIFNKIYYNLFIERFTGKIQNNFPKDYYRWDLINYLIEKKNYKNYLEIGCDQNQLFSKVKINNKIGVDPESGGNIRTTSDNFFSDNTKKFDIIFIDGLHVYEQVKKDIINSVKCLNENGIILVHDCMPESLAKQAVPRFKMKWNGDVWKAIVDLRQNEELDIHTCEIDEGIGVIQKKENSDKLIINKPVHKLKFKDYYDNYRKYLRVINLNEFKDKF